MFYTIVWLLIKRRVKQFLITQDDCWISMSSRLFKPNGKINKFTVISRKNDFPTKVNPKKKYTQPAFFQLLGGFCICYDHIVTFFFFFRVTLISSFMSFFLYSFIVYLIIFIWWIFRQFMSEKYYKENN